MQEYSPPINKRDDEELISIANSVNGDWQVDAIDQAKEELKKRGITIEEQKRRYKEQLRQRGQEWSEELERRKTEEYSPFEKIILILFWFRKVFSDWHLRKEGYELKSRQRLQYLFAGFVLTGISFVYILIQSPNVEKERIDEINKVDNSKWEKNYIGDSLRGSKRGDSTRDSSHHSE